MTTSAIAATSRETAGPRRATLPTGSARLMLVLLIAAAIAAGVVATDTATGSLAVSQAGADLTRLLRAMAVLKALLAVGVSGAVFWRLGGPVTAAWLAAYALACAAMAAGPVLVWSMAHVGAGALLLHGGLLAAVLLLWRDPVVGERLAAIVTARRAALRSHG